MLEPLPDLPDGVIGFEAVGHIHADDYRDVLVPAVEAASGAGGLRIVYVMGDRFEGYKAGAVAQDAKLGMHHLRDWQRCAVVTDHAWVDHLVNGFAWMVPAKLRVFPVDQQAEAIAWAAADADDA